MTGWACLSCPERGDTTGTESGADVKHKKATGHSVVTSTRATLLDRIAYRPGAMA